MTTKSLILILLAVTVGLHCAVAMSSTKQVCFTFQVNKDCDGCRYHEGIMCCDCKAPPPGQRQASAAISCDVSKKQLRAGCTVMGMKNGDVYEINDKTLNIFGASIKIKPMSSKPAPVKRQNYHKITNFMPFHQLAMK